MTSGRVITYDEALRAARRHFLRTGRLHVRDLADDLMVSRTTLYRVVGSRDRLLGDVMWDLARRTLIDAIRQVDRTDLCGVERLLAISRHFHDQVSRFGPMQDFLESEPEAAFQILCASTGRVHERMVAVWAALIRDAVDAGELDGLRFDPQEAAYLYVRLGESMIYGKLLAGIVPDTDLAEEVRRSLLLAG